MLQSSHTKYPIFVQYSHYSSIENNLSIFHLDVFEFLLCDTFSLSPSECLLLHSVYYDTWSSIAFNARIHNFFAQTLSNHNFGNSSSIVKLDLFTFTSFCLKFEKRAPVFLYYQIAWSQIGPACPKT